MRHSIDHSSSADPSPTKHAARRAGKASIVKCKFFDTCHAVCNRKPSPRVFFSNRVIRVRGQNHNFNHPRGRIVVLSYLQAEVNSPRFCRISCPASDNVCLAAYGPLGSIRATAISSHKQSTAGDALANVFHSGARRRLHQPDCSDLRQFTRGQE